MEDQQKEGTLDSPALDAGVPAGAGAGSVTDERVELK